VTPQVEDGVLPSGPNQVALGTRTLLDVRLGDELAVRDASGRRHDVTVVGRVVIASLTLDDVSRIGRGAVFTPEGLRRADPTAMPKFLLLDLAEGASFAAVHDRYDGIGNLLGVQPPVEVRSYAAVRATPYALAALLGVLGLGTLAHTLTTSVRGQRRELAVLKSLGLRRVQLAGIVVGQATTYAVVAGVLGGITGILFGRVMWRRFVDDLGILAFSTTPVLQLSAVFAGVVLLSNLLAFAPARRAARTSPADALRAE
jgi:putative ABC transport system permease protein